MPAAKLHKLQHKQKNELDTDMNHRYLLLLVFLALSGTPMSLLAETQYVSDDLVITLRTGQGNQFEIIKTLSSGAKLEILEETDTGYTKVKTESGIEGWVRTQYLTKEPIAAIKLEKAEAKIAKLNEKVTSLQDELTTLQKEKGQLDSEYSKLRGEHDSTSKELSHLSEIAARPKQLATENRDLRLQYEKINDELVLVKQENQVLKDRSKRNWFLTGAGVVILGMIIGLIIPKLRFRKKDSWSDF